MIRKLLIVIVALGLMLPMPGTSLLAQKTPPPPPLHNLDETTTLRAEHLPTAALGTLRLEQPEVPALSPSDMTAWSKLVYQSYRNGQWDIFSARSDGSGEMRLTAAGSHEIEPRWTRGLTRVAYASREPGNYEIYTMNPDGSGKTRLTTADASDYNPAWSPDGTKIAFNSYRDGQSEIYVMNADGSGLTRLTNHPAYDGEPAWSPDGTKIAFTSTRGADGYPSTWVMGVDGHGPSNVGCGESPAWSPDQLRLVCTGDMDGDGWYELRVGNADGSYDSQMIGLDGGYAVDILPRSWSPDGRYIAYTRINYIYYYGNWYWYAAYLEAFDVVNRTTFRLSNQTEEWLPDWQTSDVQKPTSQVSALATPSASPIVVRWSGADVGPSGILGYDLQVRDGVTGVWTTWLTRTTSLTTNYPGIGGHTYYFRSRAWDNANNAENWPASSDASTTVESLPPVSVINLLPPFQRDGLLVSWSGSDPGGSGIKSYYVQYRDAVTGTWTDWLTNTVSTAAIFAGEVGHTYAFRVRALDRALNQADWSTNSFATTFYAWQLTGQIKDERDVPVALAAAETQPAALAALPSSGGGQYATYGAALTDTYDASWLAHGFGVLPTTTLKLDADRDMHFEAFLPPADNVIANPDFETETADSWLLSGTTLPTITTQLQYSGRSAAALGDSLLALTTSANLSNSGAVDSRSPRTLEDGLGTLHVLWLEGDALYHRQRLLNGDWSPAENLTSAGVPSSASVTFDDVGRLHAMWGDWTGVYYIRRDTNGTWITQEQIPGYPWAGASPRVAVDHIGRVHAVWEQGANPYIEVFYTSRSGTGIWDTPQSLSAGCGQHSSGSQILIDAENNVHILWDCAMWSGYDDVLYQMRSGSGNWSNRVNITNDDTPSPLLAATLDGQSQLHVVWGDIFGHSLYYTKRDTAGQWSNLTSVPNAEYGSALSLGVDRGGHPHLTWQRWNSADVMYAELPGMGSWSTPRNLSQSGQAHAPRLNIDHDDRLHVVWTDSLTTTGNVLYLFTIGNGEWSTPSNLSDNLTADSDACIAIDRNNGVHVLWSDETGTANLREILYRGSPLVSASSESILSQVVTIPLTLTSPTLSFMYRFENSQPISGAELTVQADNGVASIGLVTKTTSSQTWQHAWSDLNQWRGQVLTLTFTLRQSAGEPLTRLYLDDINLGSWLTPDVQRVTPDHIGALATTVITITGGNFIPPVQVKLDDVLLLDTQWIDSSTITATAPVLPIGRYDVIVINSSGQSSGLPDALLIGDEVFLPLITR